MTAVMEPTFVWTPTERQAEVLKRIKNAPEGSTTLIGYGGAAGGAKTNLDANLAIILALQCPGSRTLVGRQDFIDLKTTTLSEFDRAIPPGLDVKYYDSAPVYRDLRASPDLPYSRVYFRGLDNWQSLMSEEFGWIIIDEAQETNLQAILALLTRLRHKPEKKWGIVATFNPFPSWPVDWFMRQDFSGADFDTANVSVQFVQSRMDDNPHLRAGYKEMLEVTLDPYTRAVMVDGDPDAAMDTVLYFDRRSIELGETMCSDPPETRLTSVAPGEPNDGHVLIWERPLTGERYYIGADTADGKGEAMSGRGEIAGPDRNAAAIYRYSDNVQVAAIYGRQEEHEYARLLNEQGRWYNNALLAVERNRRPVLVALRELEYPNLYMAEKAADMHVMRMANMQRQYEYGWLTDTKTRPAMLADFREAMSMRAIRPRDRALFREARNFIAGEKPEARQGYHDDRIFAHGIAWQARKQMSSQGTGTRQTLRQSGIQVSI